MYSGPSRQLPHGLPMYYPQPEPSYPGQASSQQLQNFQFDLPRTNTECMAASMSQVPLQYTVPSQMNAASMSWADPSMNAFDEPNYGDCYSTYSPSIMESSHGMSDIPRSMPPSNTTQAFGGGSMIQDTYDTSSYNFEPSTLYQPQSQTYSSAREHYPPASVSPSPTPKMDKDGLPIDSYQFRLPSSEESSECVPSSREMTAVVEEDHDPAADKPYAKLIYEALMSAPNHSMVLQEIYQWFRTNTVKGNDNTKGWQNSIRHNLSMNAAFKKTERKVPGDESKKSTEWVLEPFAIKDGVQSTTRYRKGTAVKKVTSRAETPAPSRQLSGSKCGKAHASRFHHKLGSHNQRQQYQQSRMASGFSGVDPGRRDQFSKHTSLTRDEQKRQRSPLTPPQHAEALMGEGVMQGYVLPKVEPNTFDHFEDFKFEHTQGVYQEDQRLFLEASEMHSYMPNHGY